TTGIAGPDSPDGQPVGTVHIGIVTPDGSSTKTLHLQGDRDSIRALTVVAALQELLEFVQE
ncbi:CinA family protein, partial [Microbacterium sp. AGC62]